MEEGYGVVMVGAGGEALVPVLGSGDVMCEGVTCDNTLWLGRSCVAACGGCEQRKTSLELPREKRKKSRG